jgi:hypothetical protein
MFTVMVLALMVATQDSSARHARAGEPRILSLIDAGFSRSMTLGGLITTSDASDAIVHLEPPDSRDADSLEQLFSRPIDSMPRIRSSDSALARLIDQATRGSETFRRLRAAIQGSNGIVYVEPGECGHGVRACLKMWMQVSGSNRFVRIVIDRSKMDRDVDVMGSLGHELQHAIEVFSEPAVTNGVTMFNFLKRTAPTDSNRFETTAAINAGNAVVDELLDRRASGR